jgi:hypothetical protein
MSSNTQICATVPQSMINDISEIAVRDNRTFSQTVALLLQQAVKERNRKRKNVKNNIPDNSADPR